MALEMAGLVLGLSPGDEVIMPSWTFPSTANAVVLRGAVPVFVDVLSSTLNLDPDAVRKAITGRTRAVFCVHYAGVACDMQVLQDICREHGLSLVEDAAQAYGSTWRGMALGGLGDLGAFSFHGTKNVSVGEGGALIVNRPDLITRAEIAWEKGTDRLRFKRGEVANYEWQDLGSSFLPSELTAALLAVQLPLAPQLSQSRVAAWDRYDRMLFELDTDARIQRPSIPIEAGHNAHIFGVRVLSPALRDRAIDALRSQGIDARSHYRPLHLSPAGRRFSRLSGPLPVTEAAGDTLIRLPLDSAITAEEQVWVVRALLAAVYSSS